MTVCCESCKSPLSVHRGSCTACQHLFLVNTRRGVCKRFRSTKGASKARRDHINSEIRNMRSLLPIPLEEQERLSYLHSMAAICTFIRKSVLLHGLPAGQGSDCSLPYEDFLHALHGFILVTTAQGKLVYVSENVSEYLGHSMVDVLQGDTIYDVVERSDFETVKSNLEMNTNPSTERSFVCHMHTSKAFRLQHDSCCSMLVQGRFHAVCQSTPGVSPSCPHEEQLFVARCTPTVNRLRSAESTCFPQSFDSVHRPDMSFTQLSESARYYLGYSEEEIIGRSFYGFLHPEDLDFGTCWHRSLLREDKDSQVEMVLRFQVKDLSWTWLYVKATRSSGLPEIRCTNFIISETEVVYLRQKIHRSNPPSSAPSRSPSAAIEATSTQSPPRWPKRHRSSSSESDKPGAKTARLGEEGDPSGRLSREGSSPFSAEDSPVFFSTPPYSPASPHSPAQQEEPGPDFLLDACGYTEQLASSPEGSPTYYLYPDSGVRFSPSHLLQAAAEQSPEEGAALSAVSVRSPDSCSALSYDPCACADDARLVPDCLPLPEMCESSLECALHPEDVDFAGQPQGGASLFQAHHVVPEGGLPVHAGLLTPEPSPTMESSFLFSLRDQVEISILAQQISCLASSFDMFHTLSPIQNTPQPAQPTMGPACDWHQPTTFSSAPLVKSELVLDAGVFDSLLKDLTMVPGKEGSVCQRPVAYSYQHGLANSLEVSQQLELECGLVQQQSSALPNLVDSLPVDPFTLGNTTLNPHTLLSGCQQQNNELHQLNHYRHSNLQQDGLAEESMY